jgi:hypothetical protein
MAPSTHSAFTDVFFGATKDTPGCVVHPDLTHLPCVDYEEKFTLQKSEYDAALDNAKLWCHATPSYHLFDVNCTTFVARVVEKAGKALPTYRGKVTAGGITADNPNTLLESLQARDKARAQTSKSKERLLAEEIQNLDSNQELRMAFAILNGLWMVGMLITFEEINKLQFLDHLIESIPVAQGVDRARLMVAMRAVKLKSSSPKTATEQIDGLLALAPNLPEQQKLEIREYLNR